ncbi:MAG TPA: nucleotidyltransferase domain-containing protein [Candidatus Merdivicinus faecavium]|nr:nucleotidyltransferase domain-containing protein [Candidatus Merdivicinus faecavium]
MEPERFFTEAARWAAGEPAVRALLLVGSWARGANRPDSDIDLMVLTDEREKFLDDPGCFSRFGEISRQSVEQYGRCTSVRVFYAGGPEVEFGLADSGWASLPLDPGTRQVLAGGFRILVDKCHIADGIANLYG